jgi:hypothetical protein
MKTAPELQTSLLSLIRQGLDRPTGDDLFNCLALDMFVFQFEQNDAYRAHCQAAFQTPDTVDHWSELPAVPTLAFKDMAVTSFPVDSAVARFDTSGTTSDQPGRHYFQDMALYQAAALVSFRAHLLPDGASLPMLVLASSPSEAPHSSLSYMLGLVADRLGAGGSAFYLDHRGLDTDGLAARLELAQREDEPVCLLGTAFAYLHWLDHCHAHGWSFDLPDGSRLMETGGFKGRARELSKPELYQALSLNLGIPEERMINEYGMTELSTQFYDDTLVTGQRSDSKPVPPWARVLVIDPRTGRPTRPGEKGMIRIIDLANLGSSICLATEDLGITTENGRFEILGRAADAGPRGCSLPAEVLGRPR